MFGDAEAYEQFMGRWSHLVAPRFVDFTNLPERGRMLDVGSGTDRSAFAIAKRKSRARVLGIDPSQEYVAYAISKNPFPDRASFAVGDAQQLHFPDVSFDAALSLLVFNFIPDPKKALFELRRVTKPGGKISAAVWDYVPAYGCCERSGMPLSTWIRGPKNLMRSACRFAVRVNCQLFGNRVASRMSASSQ